jgi:hypothetical protein
MALTPVPYAVYVARALIGDALPRQQACSARVSSSNFCHAER